MLPAGILAALGLAQLALAIPAPSNSAESTADAAHVLVARSGGFWDSCKECNLWYWTINCKCNGGWVSADLNPHISNDDGSLQWFNGGGFGGSCSGCNLQSQTLGCNCNKIGGGTNWGTVNLNSHLAYSNGQLIVN